MTKILIIEDEEKIARFIELELRHEGYETDKASDGERGLKLAEEGDFDLVILDIMLPGISGIEVLRRLRRVSEIPVILLTARDSVTDKVMGLDMGANDYITKPFAIEELLARIRVILRKKYAEAPSAEGTILCCGLELRLSSHEVYYMGKPIELTNKEFTLLKIFAENKNIAMPRERLITEAWGYDYVGETNIIDVYVRYLRQKISSDIIKTVRGVGYMLVDGEAEETN